MAPFGKQLDFLSAFDSIEAANNNIRSADSSIKIRPEAEDDDDSDPLLANQEEAWQRLEAERFSREKKNAKELQDLRARLLSQSLIPEIFEFKDFLPELEAYETRLAGFRREREAAATPEEKTKIYYKIVDPDINDEPQYRATAALYLRYREALEKQRRINRAKNKKSPQAKQLKENQDKDQVLLSSKSVQNKSTLKNQKIKIQEQKISPLVDVKAKTISNDEHSSYQDIYPMAR